MRLFKTLRWCIAQGTGPPLYGPFDPSRVEKMYVTHAAVLLRSGARIPLFQALSLYLNTEHSPRPIGTRQMKLSLGKKERGRIQWYQRNGEVIPAKTCVESLRFSQLH